MGIRTAGIRTAGTRTAGVRTAFARERSAPGAAAGALAGLVVLLAIAGAAVAQSVHEIQVGGDTVTGTIGGSADVDRVPFRLVEGSAYSFTLQSAKKSPLLLDLTVLGVDRLEDVPATAAMKRSAKGNKIVLKNVLVDESGLRYLEIRGVDGTAGDWVLKTKVKHQKKVALAGTSGGGDVIDLPFTCPGSATTTLVAKAAKGSAALPEFVSVLGTDGTPQLVDDIAPTKTGFVVKNLLLGKSGEYVLRVGSAAAGDFTVSVKWKLPKPFKRGLLDSQIVTDPILSSITPDEGDTSQGFTATVEVDFALPGATITFRKTPTVVTVPGPQVAVGEHSASFPANLSSFQQGVYDVELVNPDGGMDVLPLAFTVRNAPPKPLTINPPFGNDNQTVRAAVGGSFFQSGATVRLQRAAETIEGTGLFVSSGQISADFALVGHTPGLYDVVVTNPGPETATLAAAFEIRNSPPTLVSIAPDRNLDDPVVDAVIVGADLDPTPTAILRLAGETDIPGTSVNFVSPTQITATFDTTGAPAGAWDLVVTNPDSQQATLPGAFVVSGPIGTPGLVLSATDTFDGPPAVAHNATRGEFAAAWIDAGSGGASWNAYIQRLDETGSAIGSAVSVSSTSATVQKKDVALGWDSTNDEYLVAWSELAAIPGTLSRSPHPSDNYSTVFLVYVQRFRASDLLKQGGAVLVSDGRAFSSWPMNEFNNFRSTVVWDPGAGLWRVGFMQEWSSQNVNSYGYDDYDVIVSDFSPSTGAVGVLTGIAFTPYHEGDPGLCWDPVAGRVLVVYSARNNADTAPKDLKIGILSGPTFAGSVAVTANADDLVDGQVTVDGVTGNVLLTWTRLPASGSRTVEALLLDGDSLTSPLGSTTVLGSGSGDHFLARTLYNASTKEAMAAWTRLDGSGDLSVRLRRIDTAPSTGMVFRGPETEVSGGSGDEATPAALVNKPDGESVIFWLKTMSLVTDGSYLGSVVPGTYRGGELWFQRLK